MLRYKLNEDRKQGFNLIEREIQMITSVGAFVYISYFDFFKSK